MGNAGEWILNRKGGATTATAHAKRTPNHARIQSYIREFISIMAFSFCFLPSAATPPLSPRTLPFLSDAVFTLASGLHEILEVQNQGKGKVDGVKLRETIQRKGFADGITGPITFRSQIPDRETIRMVSTARVSAPRMQYINHTAHSKTMANTHTPANVFCSTGLCCL